MEEYPERSTSFDRRLISLCDATEHLRAITWHFLQRLNLECHILEHMTITNSYIFKKRQQILCSLLPTWQKVRFCTLRQDVAFWHYQTTLQPDLSIGLEGQGTGQMAAVLTLLGNSQQMAALSTGSSICPSSLNVLCSIKSYISEKIIQKRSIFSSNISYYE